MPTPSSKHASAPTLQEIQTQLQTAVMSGDDAVLAALTDGAYAPRGTLLGVYRHAYTARLIEVLSRDYPFLRAYIGDRGFHAVAAAFIAAHPSRSPNVRWFGAPFPEFLSSHGVAAELAELGAIERAVADAFDSADAPVLAFADLAVHAPDTWERLTFSLHPSVTTVPLTTNAFDIWRALKDEEAPPAASQLAGTQLVAVWRQGVAPRARVMDAEEAMMFREADNGVRFGVLCEMLAAFDNPAKAPMRAAGYLQSWIAGEMLTAALLAPRKAAGRDTARPRRSFSLSPQ